MSCLEGTTASSSWVCWSRLKEGWYKLNSDSAFNRSNNKASAGGMLWDNDGNWVWGFSTNIGKANSFTVELWGLREGLHICREKGLDGVLVELDSKGVVDMINGIPGNEERLATLIMD